MNLGNLDDFKTATRVRKLNLWIQILLGITLFLGLNYVASRHFEKWDFSSNQMNSLSPESAAYVKNLSKPVEFIAVFSQKVPSGDSERIKNDLRSIFNQFEYASTKQSPVKSSFVNAHIETKKAEELASRFGANLEDCVIVACGSRFKLIPIIDFYSVEDGKRTDFKGENLLTTALLYVSSGKESKIYFLKGHGELSIKNASMSGLSEFAGALTARNYKLAELDLNETKQVPEDADLLVITAAKASLLPREIDAIRKYLLKSNGRVILFLDMGSLNGLEDILYEWGLMSDNMCIYDTSGDYESSGGDLIARTFPQKPHAIARYLIDAGMPVQFGSSRPVRPDLGAPIDDSLNLTSIILSGKTSWGEKSYYRGGEQTYDDSVDIRGPLPIGMVASRTGGNKLGLTIPGGKLIVYGDENFIANKWFHRLGNSKLALNSVGWMLEENNMLNIAPRYINTYSITLSHNQITSLGLRFMILPSLVLLMAIIISLARRR